jgi:hypothetical protein
MVAMHPTDCFEFRRRTDAVVYRFEPTTPREGRPAWKRVDLGLWLAWLPAKGWCIVDAQGITSGKPSGVELADQHGEPPEGEWLSEKAGKSYVYDLVRVPASV